MKKLIFSALSVVVIAAVMTSCSKSSKGKMSNDWKIESYETNTTSVESNGDKTVTNEVFSGSAITYKETTTTNGVSETETSTATLSNPTFKIEKDGTWTMNKTVVYTYSQTPGMSVTTTDNMTESGTWSFVGKNKEEDFKKNERVLFNILNSSVNSSTVTTISGSSSTTSSNSSDTYKTGEVVMIYTINESKGKSLELTSEEANSGTYGSSSYSDSKSTTMNLVQ